MENNNDNIIMSRIAFERMQSKDEKNDRWRNIIIILLIILLAASNIAWVIAWNQYDYISDDYSIDVDAGEGDINYIGSNGDINNGANNNNETEKNPDT